MTTHPTPNLRVFRAFPQELAIEVSGPDVLLFGANAPPEPADPDAILPDLVELFVNAVNLQMFANGISGVRSVGTVESSRFDPARSSQSWRVHLAGVDPACLRVLLNLLVARELDVVSVAGAVADRNALPFAPLEGEYPRAKPPLPFRVAHEDTSRNARDRLVSIEFANPPDDPTLDAALADLEVWTQLLLFGGYAPAGMEPHLSGVLPDGPILLDDRTVQQAFPDGFFCDEAAFDAIINRARAVDAAGAPIATVTVR